MFHSLKTGNKDCEVPVNNLCLQTLRLMRERNLIYGFQYVSPGKKTKKLFPRVKILLKYADTFNPGITFIRPLKNTYSNYKVIGLNFRNQDNNNKKIMITTPKGLNLVSFNDLHSGIEKIRGKQLLEISF